MTMTNHHIALDHVQIVMVNTTLPANIGAALRAMKTMGLSRLVLVSPKYPLYQINDHGEKVVNAEVLALSAGASDLIEKIQVVEHLSDAISNCHMVFGTSARSRTIPMPLLDVRPACQQAIHFVSDMSKSYQVAIVFGREDRGLTNEELAMCNYHLTIPVNDDYGVLNVAQAIQVVCYELRMAMLEQQAQPAIVVDDTSMPMGGQLMQWDEKLVNQQQMQQFYQHFEQVLSDLEFLDLDNPRLMPIRLRRLFGRIHLDTVEYHLLRAMLSRVQALQQGRWTASKTTDSAAQAEKD
ncbi:MULTISPECIES: RNA methyltransferase [unclassified Acinetobacter]|uniref:RNA methyltransferase n=1 Tax=unclassified Acinetobacter TaxID=196816 RepID=UPI0035BB5876